MERFLHSRTALFTAALLLLSAAWGALASGNFIPPAGNQGIALPSADGWLSNPLLSFGASMAANGLIMVLMLFLNKRFNLLREISALFCVLFAAMQIATPMLLAQLNTGPVLALVVGACLALMFSCYANPDERRRVMLVFFLLSAGFATQYAYAVYLPVMLLCCWQMRVMSARAAVGIFLGLITPWWLLAAIGFLFPWQLHFHLPQWADVFAVFTFADGARLAVTLLLTGSVFVMAVVFDLFRTIAYNARARSYNGTIVLTAAITIVAMAVDYKNVTAYIPLLNMLAAMQGAQFFIIHRSERSWIGIVALLVAYASLYLWDILG